MEKRGFNRPLGKGPGQKDHWHGWTDVDGREDSRERPIARDDGKWGKMVPSTQDGWTGNGTRIRRNNEGIPAIGRRIQDDLGTTTYYRCLDRVEWIGIAQCQTIQGQTPCRQNKNQPNSTSQQRVQPMHTCSTRLSHGRTLMQKKHSRQIGGIPMISSCGNSKKESKNSWPKKAMTRERTRVVQEGWGTLDG